MDQIRTEDFSRFYKGKKVLLTGDTGFKGSWLAHWLLDLGAEIQGVSLEPLPSSLFEQSRLKDAYQSHRVDIRNQEGLLKVFKAFKPEIVFHLAAQAIVRTSYEDPTDTYSTNVMGSLSVMEAVRTTESIRSFVNVTSDKCYKNKEWVFGYRENDELGGYDPYSSSKACAEILFESYRQSYFQKISHLGVSTVRAGNVIGGGDYARDRIVPDLYRALVQDEVPFLRNPQSTRPWQHVLEPLSGYLTVAQQAYYSPASFSGPWNFGPEGDAVRTVEGLTKAFIQHWGKGTYQKASETSGQHEANLLHLSIDKARTYLQWKPFWAFDETVKKTVEWYRDVHAGNSAAQITIKQIHEFMEKLND